MPVQLEFDWNSEFERKIIVDFSIIFLLCTMYTLCTTHINTVFIIHPQQWHTTMQCDVKTERSFTFELEKIN